MQLETQLRQRSSLALGAEHRRAFAMAPTCRVLLPPRHLIPIAGCYCCSATFAQTVPSWGGGGGARSGGWDGFRQRSGSAGTGFCAAVAHLPTSWKTAPPLGWNGTRATTSVPSVRHAMEGPTNAPTLGTYLQQPKALGGPIHAYRQRPPPDCCTNQPTSLFAR